MDDKPIQVLLIEDDPEYSHLVREMLAVVGGAPFDLECADRLSTGLERLAAGDIDVVLLDLLLPDSWGLDTFIKAHAQVPGVPTIVLSGLGDEALAIEAVREGAQDYLVKGQVDGNLLVRAMRYAIGRKQAEEALSWESAANATLSELSSTLLQSTSNVSGIEAISSLVLQSARHLTGSAAGLAGYVDPQTDRLVFGATAGGFSNVRQTPGEDASGHGTWEVAEHGLQDSNGLEVSGRLWGWVLENRKPLLTNTPADDPRFIGAPQDHISIRRFLGVPALVGETLVGQVALANADRDYSERDLALVERLAALYALAIQRKWTEEELGQRNEGLKALNAIATTISQSPDLDHILNATLDKVLEVVGMDAGWIQLLDEDAGVLSLAAHRGFSQETIEDTGWRMEDGGWRMEGGQVSDDPRLSLEIVKREALHAAASVPIKSKDKVLGVLGVFRRSPGQPSLQEVQLLTAIGHQVGVAVENARLIKEASEVQVLQELNRLRTELIANVSHELRTPLGLVKVFCTTLLREDVDFDREAQREFLRDIDEETNKLEKIVDNLLDLSRMDSGRMHLDRHPTDVGQLAREVVEDVEVQLTQHRLVHDFPSDPLVATVDPKRIEQVLRNLLSNAVKYSPEGGTITVQGHSDRYQLLIRVSDQGIGIPPQDLERVFERFYRVENEVTQRVRGAGLGLAVCRGIVRAHSGHIWVESTPGEGSTFYFTLKRGQGVTSSGRFSERIQRET